MCYLMNYISHGSTNKMYTDTVVLISQLEVTSVLICNSVLITEHLAIAFYVTFKNHLSILHTKGSVIGALANFIQVCVASNAITNKTN